MTEAAVVFLAFSASYALTDIASKALWALGIGESRRRDTQERVNRKRARRPRP